MIDIDSKKTAERSGEWLAAARATMELEADAIRQAAGRLDGSLCRAMEPILAHTGKVVITGIGKSGHVGKKLVATLCSTGTPAVFLHAAEAVHGDLGVYEAGDPTLMISKSGATAELIRLVPVLREFRSPLIGILGNLASPLAAEMDVVLDASTSREADPNNLVPTASAVVAMAMGHALAMALMRARHFTAEDFGRYHPGGQLGTNLRLRVRDAMHSDGEVAWVAPDDGLKQVVIAMTRHPLGAACVVSVDGRLAGLITEGDLRRALERCDDIRTLHAADVMARRPIVIDPEARLHDAVHLMENRPSQLSVLPVVSPDSGRCVGLLRLHDIFQATPKEG
jgi:arabinose-5-phosphate isomerase